MGLYSTVEKSNLSIQEAAELDRLLDESYDPSNGISHMMEFVIQLDENDKQLFDSLIECDFLSATDSMMNEADELVAVKTDEVKKNKIWEKIQIVLKKIKDAVIKAAQQLIYKINQLTKTDEKIYNAYKDVLKVENLKGFKGITNFAYPKADVNTQIDIVKDISSAAGKFSSAVGNAKTKEDVDNVFQNFESTLKNTEERLENLADEKNSTAFNDKVENFVPSDDKLKYSLEIVKNGNEYIKQIKDMSKKCVGLVKDLETFAKAVLKRKEENEVEIYKANKLSHMTSMSAKTLSRCFSAFTRRVTVCISAHRKVVILCGRYAAKYAKGGEEAAKSSTNESLEWFLAESSDAFVFEQFAY